MSFQGVLPRLALVVECKGCHQPVPTGLRSIPDNPVAIRCPLCNEHRYYRSGEVYEGRVSFQLQGSKK
jgi:hypothetical protein